MPEKAKLCPFCGQEPFIGDSSPNKVIICCVNANCSIAPSYEVDDQLISYESGELLSLMLEKWNTRY